MLAQLGNQTDILWEFNLPTDTLWLPKTVRQVLHYANDLFSFRKSFSVTNKIATEDQSKKQMETTNGKEHGKKLIRSNGKKDSLKLLKQKEIFDELFNKRMF